jgi:hypothetical protein
MREVWQNFVLGGKPVDARLSVLEKKDRKVIKDLYHDWKKLNDRLKAISTRGINLPETISENAFCIFFKDCHRVIKLKKGKCSYDVINTKTGKRIQIKASSVGSDLTSFGPRSEWDELFFLDFSKGNGLFKAYKIEPEWIYKHKVNKNQTFEDQQKQGRRPRFSIIGGIIKPKKLKPAKVSKL